MGRGAKGAGLCEEQRNPPELCLLLITIIFMLKIIMTSIIRTADSDVVLIICQSIIVLILS